MSTVNSSTFNPATDIQGQAAGIADVGGVPWGRPAPITPVMVDGATRFIASEVSICDHRLADMANESLERQGRHERAEVLGRLDGESWIVSATERTLKAWRPGRVWYQWTRGSRTLLVQARAAYLWRRGWADWLETVAGDRALWGADPTQAARLTKLETCRDAVGFIWTSTDATRGLIGLKTRMVVNPRPSGYAETVMWGDRRNTLQLVGYDKTQEMKNNADQAKAEAYASVHGRSVDYRTGDRVMRLELRRSGADLDRVGRDVRLPGSQDWLDEQWADGLRRKRLEPVGRMGRARRGSRGLDPRWAMLMTGSVRYQGREQPMGGLRDPHAAAEQAGRMAANELAQRAYNAAYGALAAVAAKAGVRPEIATAGQWAPAAAALACERASAAAVQGAELRAAERMEAAEHRAGEAAMREHMVREGVRETQYRVIAGAMTRRQMGALASGPTRRASGDSGGEPQAGGDRCEAVCEAVTTGHCDLAW